MVRVAIAGGSGGLGRVITQAIEATKRHEVFVLSRKSSQAGHIQALEIDYSSVDGIATTLRENRIEVVLSAIGVIFEDAHIAQMNLIEGAERSGTVKRFAPSDGFSKPVPSVIEYNSTGYRVKAMKKLQTTGMEHTRFIIGFLMDYYGFPAEPIPVTPLAVVLDMDKCRAAIPADGNAPVTFTHSETIAKFVVASLDLPSWPSKSWIVGDTISWNEALAIAEDVRGRDFDVFYDSIEDLGQAKITELPGNVARYAVTPKPFLDGILSAWSLGFAEGWFNLPAQTGTDRTLNDICPTVEVLGFRAFLEKVWKRDSRI
ncbi:hypothetical protein F5X68DRAFT_144529 [Plectosphaerella plurivora]|uniref:NmrA-like domain-containing protein n=1 Tax=Plectosphaerella plurivora TaxID=936078 RepID=A0A9P8V0F1_9PEZI|nr:hypothetical protein F5X68DRAFT_144529 [Plectosphaerella plurivora]